MKRRLRSPIRYQKRQTKFNDCHKLKASYNSWSCGVHGHDLVLDEYREVTLPFDTPLSGGQPWPSG